MGDSIRTSSSCAEGAVAMATLGPLPHDGAVDVLGIVGPDIACASAAVGDFWDTGHGDDGNDVLVLLTAIYTY